MKASIVISLLEAMTGSTDWVSVFKEKLSEISDESAELVDAVDTEDGLEITVAQDGVETTFLLTTGEEGLEAIVYGEDENDENNYDTYIDLSDFAKEMYDDSTDSIDFAKLPADALFYILTGELPSEEVEEASITVIRGGKKVKKVLKRKKRPKPLNAKKRAGIRKAVLKRKKTAKLAMRRRAKSILLRKRSKLKKKPTKFRV